MSAWLDWRREGITATDVARAVTGRYGGAYAVVLEKRGGDQDETDRMRRGRELEATVAAMAQLATGRFVAGEQTMAQADHIDRPEWRATLDGFLLERPGDALVDAYAILELKTVGTDVRPAWDYYRAQVQWQLLVTGFDRALLAVAWVADDTLEITRNHFEWVSVDPAIEALLIDVAVELGVHLNEGTLPDPDGSDRATELVRAHTYTTVPDAETVDLTGIAETVERRQELKPIVDEGLEELRRLDNIIREAVGQAKWGTTGTWDVTYSAPRRVFDPDAALEAHPDYATTGFDRARFEADHGPKALDEYRASTGARTITIRRAKDMP
jgi:predicted phage-related endonuclease